MSLSLAKIPLILPTAEVAGWVRRHIDPRDAAPWSYRASLGKNLGSIAQTTGFEEAQEIQLNTFRFPWSASRFGHGFFLASRDQADQVRDAACGKDGMSSFPVTLAMDTPGLRSAESVEIDVTVLAPVPLGRVPDGSGGFDNGLYLLPVVDNRYFWWSVPCPDFAIDGYNVQWTDLFAKVGTALGLTVQVDAISSDYRVPHPSLNLKDEVLPPVFDAIAMNVGQRIIYQFDGSVRSINATTAGTLRTTDDGNFPMRSTVGGGTWFLDDI